MSDATFEGLHGYRSSHHSWFPIKVCNIHISANVLPPAVCICVLSSFVYRWRIYRWPHLCCSHAGRGSILWLVITLRIKVKVKVTLEQATKAQREVEVYLYSFFNFVARWGGGQRHAPAALLPGKTRYPLYRRGGGPQDRAGRVRKISPTPGFNPRIVQPVASRYTDWAIPAPLRMKS